MRFNWIIGLLIVINITAVKAQSPKLILLDGVKLTAKKEDYRKGKAEVVKEVSMVIKNAEKLLDIKPASVISKAFTPPSGSKHDYMSLAPYFWPDPSKADGLPYIRKDGQRNPEIRKITDGTNLAELERRCRYLSLAYYFTRQEKYAARASLLLHTWFLNPETKMNPNLNYAQAIPGVNDGRGIGIIESRHLENLADWMILLQGSASFTGTDLAAIKSWYQQYTDWMLTSKNGIDEHHSQNNHGTHYDAQVIAYTLFTGNEKLAKTILDESKKRIATQIEPDGEQKLELERTNALSYSTMNLGAWFNIATLGDKAGVDIWNYTTPDGRSIQQAFNWLAPYALGQKPWTFQQIVPYQKDEFYPVLIQAGAHFTNSPYALKKVEPKEDEGRMLTDLLYN